MKPGNELDEKIADIVYPTWRDDFGKSDWSDLPCYSTDIGDAWIAWEWLEKRRYYFWISLQRDNENRPAVYRHGISGNRVEVASGETYPHAICLAVLACREASNEHEK